MTSIKRDKYNLASMFDIHMYMHGLRDHAGFIAKEWVHFMFLVTFREGFVSLPVKFQSVVVSVMF